MFITLRRGSIHDLYFKSCFCRHNTFFLQPSQREPCVNSHKRRASTLTQRSPPFVIHDFSGPAGWESTFTFPLERYHDELSPAPGFNPRMPQQLEQRACRASLHAPASPPPENATGRIPASFAASFLYQGEGRVRHPNMSSCSTSEASSSLPNTLRRSPRAKQLSHTDLCLAFSPEDDQSDKASRVGSNVSFSKRRMNDNREVTSLDIQASRGSDGQKKGTSRKRIRRTRDDPNSASGSIYAHLQAVPDLFAERNDIMLCGINPGVKSSSSGHHFAHRSNHFYPSLHLAGITSRRMKPEQDVEFPFLRPYSLGLTNLAPRPTAEGNELLPSELIDGVPVLLEKILKWKPRSVCFVGKGISEAFVKGLKHARAIRSESSRTETFYSRPVSPRARPKPEHSVKLEYDDTSLDATPTKVTSSEHAAQAWLQVSIPADVLCAYTAPIGERKDVKPREKGLHPSTKKQLYTKGKSKDDAGYGVLPLCVPHSTPSRGSSLTLDQVSLLFVSPSSSARVTTHFLDDKARILASLRRLIEHLQASSITDAPPSNGHFEFTLGNGSGGKDDKLESDTTGANESSHLLPQPEATKTIYLEIVDLSRISLGAVDA